MDNEQLNYSTRRAWTLEGFRETMVSRNWSSEMSVAFEMEEASTWVKDDPTYYAAVIVSLSIICLREGVLPDFLSDRIPRLPDPDELSEDDRALYSDDLATLHTLLQYVPYQVNPTAGGTERLDILLEGK